MMEMEKGIDVCLAMVLLFAFAFVRLCLILTRSSLFVRVRASVCVFECSIFFSFKISEKLSSAEDGVASAKNINSEKNQM